MLRTGCVALVAAASLVLATRRAPQQAPPGPAGSFGENALWDDGKAEICLYDAEEIVEGEKRSFEAVSIVVAERFDQAQMVKSEQFDLSQLAVLKCNWLLSIPTGVARCQQMASLVLQRSDLLAIKAVFSSQDWCGATFAEWRRDRPQLVVHSYLEGEGDQVHPLTGVTDNTLFLEQLPLWIRGRRPERVRTEKITLIPKRLATSRCPPPKLVAAAIAFDGMKEEGGTKRIEARLLVEGRDETFVLSPEFPYVMTEWRRADGTSWKLKKATRLDFWNFTKNEHAGDLTTR